MLFTLEALTTNKVLYMVYPLESMKRSKCLLKHALVELSMTWTERSFQLFATLVNVVNSFRNVSRSFLTKFILITAALNYVMQCKNCRVRHLFGSKKMHL